MQGRKIKPSRHTDCYATLAKLSPGCYIFCTCIISNRISPYPCIMDSLCFSSKRIALHILIFWQSNSYANTMFERNNFEGLSSIVLSMSLISLRNFLSNRGTFVLDKLFFCCFYSITANILKVKLNVLSVMEWGGGILAVIVREKRYTTVEQITHTNFCGLKSKYKYIRLTLICK